MNYTFYFISVPSTSTSKNNFRESNSLSFKTSLSLLDEILENQNKVLAPSSLLKVNRDGTLAETEEYRHYLEKKNLVCFRIL